MLIDRAARAESLDYLEGPEDNLALPVFSSLPSEPDAIATFLDELKPRRYAALASVINVQLAVVQATPLTEYYTEGTASYPDDPYRRLRGYALAAFWASIEEIKDTPEYQRAAEYPRLIGQLDPSRAIDLQTQLSSGSETATSSMLTHARHIPAMLRHHAPRTQLATNETAAVAKRSTGLPWRMAMMCINQMMAAKSAVSRSEAMYESWAGSEVRLDPERFKLQWINGRPYSLDFDGLKDAELPEGYTPQKDIPPLSKPTPISEIECSDTRTIGCPITLKPELVNGVWGWLIDGIDQREMWE